VILRDGLALSIGAVTLVITGNIKHNRSQGGFQEVAVHAVFA
jgi:hypothetical protein